VVKGNIVAVPFANGVVSTLIYSSVIHEIRSYNGYSTELVRETLRRSRRRLRVGGRIIIRDGIKPAPQKVWMRCDAETEERFRRFAVDFKKKSHNPGVRFEERELEGQKWFLLSMHDASEFLSKKDYLKNWDIEVNEEFGTFTLEEWKEELEAAGYRVVEARSYVNEWIKTNRYDGKVWLHADLGDRPGELLPFPDTTCVIVGEKLALAPRIRNILHKRFGRVASAASRLIELRRTVLRPGRKT
jgi:SAM-dependent methyltransferase